MNHKEFLFHHIPKTGGWTLKSVFSKHPGIIYNAHSKMKEEVLDKYNAFCFVRNPINRFLSCWNYFCGMGNVPHDRLIGEYLIIKWNNINAFILNEKFESYLMNAIVHFRPMLDLIVFPEKYWNIFKFENFDEESKFILNTLNIKSNIIYKNKSKITPYYSTREDLTDDSINKLYELYKVDFETFGYTID